MQAKLKYIPFIHIFFGSAVALFSITGCHPDNSHSRRKISAATSSLADTIEEKTNAVSLLIPGKAAGSITIDENTGILINKFGKPDGGDAAMGKAIAVWYQNRDSATYSIAVYSTRDMGNDETSRVKQIRITAPAFKTAEGLHTGSSLTEINKYFHIKKTETYRDRQIIYTIYDSDRGIAFEINPAGECVSIIIHPAGTNNMGTYLKFRTTNTKPAVK